MFTMKHIMRPKAGESTEFVRSLGTFAVKRKDGYFQFLAYDGGEFDGPPAVWSGWDGPQDFANPVVGMIYVTNEAGATIADYSYNIDGDTLEEVWPEPLEVEQADAEKFAA